MLDVDSWQEILDTVRKNKLRTFLTGFSVCWGIFILIILLGSGHGLANGVEYQFRDDAVNSIWIRPGQTSLPHQGLKPGRQIQFTNEDHDEIVESVHGVELLTGIVECERVRLVTHRRLEELRRDEGRDLGNARLGQQQRSRTAQRQHALFEM